MLHDRRRAPVRPELAPDRQQRGGGPAAAPRRRLLHGNTTPPARRRAVPPHAAELSSAAGSRQPAAQRGRLRRCSGSPGTRHEPGWPAPSRRGTLGTRSLRSTCVAVRNPALALTAARAVLLSLTRRLCLRPDGAGNLGKRRARAAAKDARSHWTAAHWLGSLRHPAARPLALRANQAKTTGPCPDLPLNLLTGQSSGYGLPSWCWRCFLQPGAGGSSPLRRRTCPPCRQAPSSRGIWTNVLRALSSATAVLVLGNYSPKHAAGPAGSNAV